MTAACARSPKSFAAKWLRVNPFISPEATAALTLSIAQVLIDEASAKCEMMGNAELSIADISRSVGYNDPLLFSKMFKKVKGSSPKNYRTEIQAQIQDDIQESIIQIEEEHLFYSYMPSSN
jgi:AraC-like DNA-binding protein